MYAWKLTRDELKATQAKIDKINSIASRKGLSGRLTVEAKEITVKRDVVGIEVSEIRFETTITGEPPKHDGWVFLASLEWIETGVITRNAPGAKVMVDRDALTPGYCDHCGYNRRRKTTYVVLNEETGKQVQVGSSCLKDFLGWSGSVVFFTEDEIREEVSSCSGWGTPEFTTESILAVAWACVTEFGYKRSREEGSTAGTVWTVLGARENKYTRKVKERIRPIAKDAIPMARKLREFVLSDDFRGDNDYVLNLKTYCKAEYNSARSFGFLASVTQAYAKHLDYSLIKQRKQSELVSDWVGAVKEKLTLNVKIKAVRFVPTKFGCSTLYTFLADTGHIFKWFATQSAFGEDETTEFFTIQGSVKKHEEFNGFKSTLLTRCKKV